MTNNPSAGLPAVDVVIGTFNCVGDLRQCLKRIRAQDYPGKLELIVVDAGSTDGTLDVARQFSARVYVNPGQALFGLQGARNFGQAAGTSEFVWYIDSDNFIVEDSVARDLMQPFCEIPNLTISMPETIVDSSDTGLNRYLSLIEIQNVDRLKRQGRRIANQWLIKDVSYGLTNAAIVRKSALRDVGGFDTDVRLLERLRRAGLATGVVVSSAHFVHKQTTSVLGFRKKWLSKLRRGYATMDKNEARAYFVESSLPEPAKRTLSRSLIANLFGGPIRSIGGLMQTGDPIWLYGLAHWSAWVSVLALHPRLSRNALSILLS